MDGTAVILKVIEVIPRFFPRPKPPVVDYSSLYMATGGATEAEAPQSEVSVPPKPPSIEVKTTPVMATRTQKEGAEGDVSTGCIACSRSHLSTVSGALGESLRFARDEGITHPEVQRRLMLAEDEINIMERIDLAPDALAQSPPEEKQLAEEYLPRIRKLRQNLGKVTSVEELEDIAAESSVLGQEFRLRHLQLQGVDLNPVMELARKVQSGEISMDDAKAQLRQILPEEE